MKAYKSSEQQVHNTRMWRAGMEPMQGEEHALSPEQVLLAQPEPRMKLEFSLMWPFSHKEDASETQAAEEVSVLKLLILVVGAVLVVLVLAVVGATDVILPVLNSLPGIP